MMGANFWLEIANGPRLGVFEVFLVVKCVGGNLRQSDRFLLGGQRKDVSRSIRRVRRRVMCGLGVLVGLVDGRLLRDVETKVAGSFLPRQPH